jgi:hypothetical protein
MSRIVKGPWRPEEDERLRALASAGLNAVEIANEIKRSDRVVRSRASQLKIPLAKSTNQGVWLDVKRSPHRPTDWVREYVSGSRADGEREMTEDKMWNGGNLSSRDK